MHTDARFPRDTGVQEPRQDRANNCKGKKLEPRHSKKFLICGIIKGGRCKKLYGFYGVVGKSQIPSCKFVLLSSNRCAFSFQRYYKHQRGIYRALSTRPFARIVAEESFNCYRYSIVTAEEWSKLTQFYEVDYPIIIKKTNDDYQTNPGKYDSISHSHQGLRDFKISLKLSGI